MRKAKKVLGVMMGLTMFLSLIAGDVYAESPVEELGEKQGDISDTTITEAANSADGQDTLERETDVSSVATGQYADWKNNAITYPAAGQLVAAGFISVKFAPLDGAVKYQVYLDDELIETVEDSDGETAEYQVEFRNREVKGHTVYVVAALENGAEITSNIRTFYVSKKGMGIWQGNVEKIEELNLSWYYNWSPNELTGVSDKVEFVPMIWGRGSEDWLETGDWRNYRYLLTFNEPDRADQANMTPENVVGLWNKIQPLVEEPSIAVSSPAVSSAFNFMEGWYGNYAKLMAAAEYHDEFIAVHFYFDYPGMYILDTLEEIHEKTGKPIWITEWGVAQWSQIQEFDWTGGPDKGNWQRDTIVKFMAEILPQLDKLDYIERYAWFPFDGSNTEKFGNGAGGLFFETGKNNTEKGALTSVGEVYQQYGNPDGWDPENPTQDVVVTDKDAPSNPSQGGSDKDDPSNPSQGGSDKDDPSNPSQGGNDKDDPSNPSQGGNDKDDSSNPSQGSSDKDDSSNPSQGGSDKDDSSNPSQGSSDKDEISNPPQGGSGKDDSSNPPQGGTGTGDTKPAAGDTFSSAKLSYELVKSSDGTLTAQVTGPEVKTQTKITIPAAVKYNNQEFKVTAIAKNAFKKNTKLKSVTIGANVTSIGSQAFYGCKKLTSVTIGKKVKTIGTKAFYQCSKLKKVTFKGAAVKKIGSKAFIGTNKKITFKAGSKKNVTKYKKLLKKKMPSTAKITK